ncbi:uncharacterized protein UHOD_11840 [Ustilago sp. UG-2017b]|nr:uncharacterized protein UHOD_11840 [Ustilago sp. UG-2017b]
MPSQPNDPHIANDPSPIPAPAGHQTTTKHDTSSSDNSDSDDNETNKPLLDLNDINKLNITSLRNMLIESTLRKQAEISAYKKPSRRSTFHQELLYINDALVKETPKLTTKNWYVSAVARLEPGIYVNGRLESVLVKSLV